MSPDVKVRDGVSMSFTHRSAARLVPLGLVGLLAGCGSSEQRSTATADSPRAAVTEYIAALRAHDGDRLCALITPTSRALVSRTAGRRCAAVMGRRVSQPLPNRTQIEQAEITVSGDRALVQLGGGGGPIGLTRIAGVWRVEAFGPQTDPAAGRARSNPTPAPAPPRGDEQAKSELLAAQLEMELCYGRRNGTFVGCDPTGGRSVSTGVRLQRASRTGYALIARTSNGGEFRLQRTLSGPAVRSCRAQGSTACRHGSW